MSTPETRYARSGDVNIAYQVIGGGRLDLILALGFATHVEVLWELPAYAHLVERRAPFPRVIVFEKRGMGLSDRPSVLTTFEEQLDDLRAVLDASGSERAALLGFAEGGPTCLLFAATYPARTSALVPCASYAKATRSPDYPFGPTPEVQAKIVEKIVEKIAGRWEREALFADATAPSLAHGSSTRSRNSSPASGRRPCTIACWRLGKRARSTRGASTATERARRKTVAASEAMKTS